MTVDLESLTKGDPYIEDGNVILRSSDDVLFRVHIGVLARQSEVFDVFRLPQPKESSEDEQFDGCAVIRLEDHSIELGYLLHGLYDGVTFANNSVSDFYHLAAILRLSTKYCMSSLRLKAIRYLSRTWAPTLSGHDALVHLAMNLPHTPEKGSYPYVHPLHVLNLARETNAEVLIPCASYFLSLYPLPQILEGTHAKLHVDEGHPSRPSEWMGAVDVRNYALLFQFRMEKMLFFTRNVCIERGPSPNCTKSSTPSRQFRPCSHTINRLGATLSRSWQLRTGVLHFMVQAVEELGRNNEVCRTCRGAFEEDVRVLREEIWMALPGVVGLPGWEVLERQLDSE